MAGKEANIDNTVTGWLLEYVYQVAWDNFKIGKSVDVGGIRDLIQWFGCQKSVQHQSDPDVLMKIQLMVILSRLTDGPNYDTSYRMDQDCTVLEDMLMRFRNLTIPTNLKQEYTTVVNLIMKQAVIVCCKEGDFTIAEEVFDRLWKNSKDSENQVTKERLHKLIQAGVKSHHMITVNSYESFTDKVIDFLSLINKEFDTPFLIKVAREQEKRYISNGVQESANSKDRRLFGRDLKKLARRLDGDNKDLSNFRIANKAVMQKKLDRVRNKEIKKWLEDCSSSEHVDSNGNQSPSKFVTSPDSSDNNSEKAPFRCPSNFKINKYKKNSKREDRHSPAAGANRKALSDFEEDDILTSPKKKIKLLRPPSPTESIFGGVRKRWDTKETEEFYQAVQSFGVGCWSEIQTALDTERSNVQLKDRWRTLHKTGEVQKLEQKFGPV